MIEVSLLRRILGTAEPDPRQALRPLYAQIVAKARQPHWYVDGGVPDSVNGRFEMVSAILSLLLVRLEREPQHAGAMALLTEIFVADMDAQLRELGVGDMIVGKRIGKLMGAFGGRLGAYREALAQSAELALLNDVLQRNVYEDAVPAAGQLAHVSNEMRATAAKLSATDSAQLVSGEAEW